MYIDVDLAVVLNVNIQALTDDTDFKSREVSIAYDESGMLLEWIFTTSAGATTREVITLTTGGGDYDWTHLGGAKYTVGLPASGGASVDNDTEGTGHFEGICDGVLGWRSVDFTFRAAALNDQMIDSQDPGDYPASSNQVGSISPGAGGSINIEVSYDNTTTDTIDNAGAVDKGGGLVGIPVTGHAFIAGREITIASTTNYNGAFEIISQTTNEVVITSSFTSETFAGSETIVSSIKGIVFVGSVQGGTTFANTEAEDGVYHDIDDVGDDIDVVYVFTVGGGRSAAAIDFAGFVQGNGDQMNMKVYDHIGTTWDTIGTISGKNSSNNDNLEFPLLLKHTGTGSDSGDVYIRMDTTSTTPSNLSSDRLIVEAVNIGQTVGYSGGQIWINTNLSNTNTEPFVDGVADHTVSTLEAALTLSANTLVKLVDFHVINGSSITFAASMVNKSMVGDHYTVVLGGQACSGLYLQGANVSGVATSSGGEMHFEGCELNEATVELAHFDFCGILGPMVLNLAGGYKFHNCYSAVVGASAPTISKTAGQTITAEFRNYAGGLTLSGLEVDDILTIGGTLGTIDLGSPAGAVEIEIRGTYKEIINVGSASLNTDGAIKGVDVAAILVDTTAGGSGPWTTGSDADLIAGAVWNALSSDYILAGSFGNYIDVSLSSLETDISTAITNQASLATEANATVNTNSIISEINENQDYIQYVQNDVDTIVAKLPSGNISDFDEATDTVQINTTGGSATGGSDADDLVNYIWDEQNSEHLSSGSTGESLDDAGVGASTPADIADAVWDELSSDHVISGSFGDYIDVPLRTIETVLGTPENINSQGATISDNIRAMVDDDGGTTFDSSFNSLKIISESIIALTPVTKTATADNYIQGDAPIGDYIDTKIIDTNYMIVSPTGTTSFIHDLEVFLGDGLIPNTLRVLAQYDTDTPTANKWVNVSAYNHISEAYEEISSVGNRFDGENNPSSDIDLNFLLNDNHVNGTDEVYIRFESEDIDDDSLFSINYAAINAVSQSGLTAQAIADAVKISTVGRDYLARVWVGTANGDIRPGDVVGTNGLPDFKSSNWVDAQSLDVKLGFNHFDFANISDITLDTDLNAKSLVGAVWTINFASFDITRCNITGALLKGIAHRSVIPFPVPIILNDCSFGECTLPPFVATNCSFGNTLTLDETSGVYSFIDSNSASATTPPTVVFNSGSEVSLRNYNGDIEASTMVTGNILTFEGRGTLDINSNCTGGTIVVSGTVDIIGGVAFEAGGGTITETSNINHNNITSSVWDSLSTDYILSGSFGNYIDVPLSSLENDIAVVDGVVDNINSNVDVAVSTRASEANATTNTNSIVTEINENQDYIQYVQTDVDTIVSKLPTNFIMGSSDASDKDDEIDYIYGNVDRKLSEMETNITDDIAEITSDTDPDAIAGAVWNALSSDYITPNTFGNYVDYIYDNNDRMLSETETLIRNDIAEITSDTDPDAIAGAVWNALSSDYITPGSFGEYIDVQLSSMEAYIVSEVNANESDLTSLQVDVTAIKAKTDQMNFNGQYILSDVEAIDGSEDAAFKLSAGMGATVLGKVKDAVTTGWPVNQITVYDLDPSIVWNSGVNSKIFNNRVLTFKSNGVGAGQVILINDTTAGTTSGEFILSVTDIVEPGTGNDISANDEFIIA